MKKLHCVSIFSVALVLASAIFLTNCKGTDGAVGPQGATRAVGATGPAGPAGAKGDAGTSTGTGTNNVIQVTFTATYAPPKPGNDKVFTFPAAVTSDILDKGAVSLFVETSNFPNNWYTVPGAAISVGGGPADLLRGQVDTAARQIGIIRESGTNITNITRTRAVIIPAGAIINGRKAAIDNNDYNAVKAAYNLLD